MNRVELGPYVTKGKEHRIYEAPNDSSTLIKRPRWYNIVILNAVSTGHAARTVERELAEAQRLDERSNGTLKIPETEIVSLYRGRSYRMIQRRVIEDNSVEDVRGTLVAFGDEQLVRRFDRADENFISENGAVHLIDFTINPLSRITNSLNISDKQVTKVLIARRRLVRRFKEKTQKFRRS